jgi:hypothetical protein
MYFDTDPDWRAVLVLNLLLDAHKVPGGDRTPKEHQRSEVVIDVWANLTSTPEEHEAALDEFLQQQREAGTG